MGRERATGATRALLCVAMAATVTASLLPGWGATADPAPVPTLWDWGRDPASNPATNIQPTPRQVPDLSGAKDVAVGNAKLAAMADGTVVGWGSNASGEVGDGTTVDRRSPVPVVGLTDVTAVAARFLRSLALRSDGTVWAWGAVTWTGIDGQSSATPVQIPGLSAITAIEAGAGRSFALRDDGTVWGWGVNWDGGLGDGTTIDRATPVQVSGLTGVTAIAIADAVYAEKGSYALKADGTVWRWGAGPPTQVAGLSDVTSLAGGLAARSDGSAWVWGGLAGDGTGTYHSEPVQVPGLTDVTSVVDTGRTQFAVKADGTLWAWGANLTGSLGDATTVDRLSPVQVAGLGGVSAVAANDESGLAIAEHGAIPSDEVTVSFKTSGGIEKYHSTGMIDTGDIAMARDSSGIRSVAGTATMGGGMMGTATVTFGVNRFWILPLYLGTVRVDDPYPANLPQSFDTTHVLFFARVDPVGSDGATSTSSWLYASFLYFGYSMTWTVHDRA